MTVKDQFNITNFDTTLGYVGRCDKPATEDAAIIQILTKLGAIVIAKSNLPQSIMVSVLKSWSMCIVVEKRLTLQSGQKQTIRYGDSQQTLETLVSLLVDLQVEKELCWLVMAVS